MTRFLVGTRSAGRRSFGYAQRDNEASRVVAWLRWLNCQPETFAWRMETDGKPVSNGDGSFRLVRNGGGRGKPDICICKAGRCAVIEAKMPGKHAEDHQRDWMLKFVERGKGKAAVIHDSAELETFWREI